jgi:putative Ig domain-containing protein
VDCVPVCATGNPIVDENSKNAAETFTITVSLGNQPPVLAPIGPRTVSENAPLTTNLSASDPDGGTLTFSSTALPTGSTLVHPMGLKIATFTWTPAVGQAGSYPITITVKDSGTPQLSDSDTFTITVTAAATNHPPTVTKPGPRSVNEGPLSLTIAASDPNGDAVTLSASGLPSGATLSSTGAFSWRPTSTGVGSYNVTATAADGSLPSAPATFTITVQAQSTGSVDLDILWFGVVRLGEDRHARDHEPESRRVPVTSPGPPPSPTTMPTSTSPGR